MCWYLFSFSWLEICDPSDMITGLFSFSCTLYVVCACLSVCPLSSSGSAANCCAKTNHVNRFLRRVYHLFR